MEFSRVIRCTLGSIPNPCERSEHPIPPNRIDTMKEFYEKEIKGVQYSDYEGNELLWSSRAKDKDSARLLFSKWLTQNGRHADLDTVQLTRKWYCRSCNFYTSGEQVCCECGKYFTSNGRAIYEIFLSPQATTNNL